jgi:hypothetical protein
LFVATVRLRIPEHTWTGPFSRRHPEASIELLNRSDVGANLSVSDHWISGQPPGVWGNEIGTYRDVVRVDSLAEVGEGTVYRVTLKNPPVVYLYRRLGLPLPLPLRIRAGILEWEVVARPKEFREVLKFLRRADPGARVTSIRRQPLRDHLPQLTDTQHALLTQAMAAGYFAVPRRITLTELARKVERSKSAVSEAIALIERKLLESALHVPPLLRSDSFARSVSVPGDGRTADRASREPGGRRVRVAPVRVNSRTDRPPG